VTAFVTVGDVPYDAATIDILPSCKLNDLQCDILHSAQRGYMGQYTFSNSGNQRVAYPPGEVCPMRRYCDLETGEVVLIYWPDNAVSRDLCGSRGSGSSATIPWSSRGTVVTKAAITFRGKDIYIRSINGEDIDYATGVRGLRTEFFAQNPFMPYTTEWVMEGPFTFTSPTVYLAHKAITRREMINIYTKHNVTGAWVNVNSSWVGLKVIRPEGIIPLNSTEIFSIRTKLPAKYGGDSLSFAHDMASGKYDPVIPMQTHNELFETVPFDFGHLQAPPAAAYYMARTFDCLGKATHCGTITDDDYRPNIRLSRSVWARMFTDFDCMDPLAVDPPIALTPLNTVTESSSPQATLTKFVPSQPNHLTPPQNPPEDPWREPPRPGQALEILHPLQTGPPGISHDIDATDKDNRGQSGAGRNKGSQSTQHDPEGPARVPLPRFWWWRQSGRGDQQAQDPGSDATDLDREADAAAARNGGHSGGSGSGWSRNNADKKGAEQENPGEFSSGDESKTRPSQNGNREGSDYVDPDGRKEGGSQGHDRINENTASRKEENENKGEDNDEDQTKHISTQGSGPGVKTGQRNNVKNMASRSLGTGSLLSLQWMLAAVLGLVMN
jgi:hypothetical protein